MYVQRWNQMRARLSAQRDSGAAITRGDLTATAWRKSNTLSQLSEMVVNVSAVACFALPGFANFVSSASMVMTLSSLLSSSASLVFSPSFTPLCDGASENIQELACFQLPVEDRVLREKWREEDGIAWSPVSLLL